MSHGPGKIYIVASIVFCAYLGLSPREVRANSGTQLNFNEWQAGTEHTNLVPNGNFETGDTTDWTPTGETQVVTPINPPNPSSTTGSFAFQTLAGSPTDTDPDTLTSTTVFNFDPNTKYVVSAYVWAFSSDAEILLKDPSTNSTTSLIELEPNATDGQSGSDGYFVYSVFNGSSFSNGAQVMLDGFSTAGDSNPETQFDNIAITPLSDFLGPQPKAVPEPASISLGLFGAASLLMRRRR